MKILVTGAAGFLGSRLALRLVRAGHSITGIDNLNDSYDVRLKLERLKQLGIEPSKGRFIDGSTHQSSLFPDFTFIRMDLADRGQITQLFQDAGFDAAVNLAGQSGLSDSISSPYSCIDSNLVGFMNILENCRRSGVKHLIYASSASVYGTGGGSPSSEDVRTDCPMSLNAATKKAAELMAHSYSELYGLPTTGIRLFTVYGPWSRPDTTSMIFATAISEGRPCTVFGDADAGRDFIYIDDAVEIITRCLEHIPGADFTAQETPSRIYNAGSGTCTRLANFIERLGQALGRTATVEFLPAKRGRITGACADTSRLESELGYTPSTGLDEGIARLAEWFRSAT